MSVEAESRVRPGAHPFHRTLVPGGPAFVNYPQTWLSLSLSFQLLEGWSVHVEVLSLTAGSQLFPGPTSH